MLRIKHLIILILLLVILSAGCSNSQKDEEAVLLKPENENPVIGVSILDLDNPYFVQVVKGIESRAKEMGIDVIINDPKSDSDNQRAAVEEFIERGVDVIIIAALDPGKMESLLEKAMDSGIKVIAQSTWVEHCNIFITAEEWEMGYTIGCGAGQWIRDQLNGYAQVGIIGYPRVPQILNREKGIRDGLEEFAPRAKVVDTQSAGNPYEGELAAESMLAAYPDIKVIISVNDGGALGAYNVFEQSGKDLQNVFIGGVDATPESLEKIRAGTFFRATVDIDPYANGKIDMDFAYKLIKGQIVPHRYSISTKLVTIDNIDEY